MKKCMQFSLLLLLSFGLVCCSQKSDEAGKVLVRVNDFNLTLEEFQSQLASEMEIDDDLKLTQTAKKEFLDELITKEVLIQEAQKLHLDRKKDFVKTIERYWEATLIRNLLEIKGDQISKRILISENEIKAYYNHLKKTDDRLPELSAYRATIIQDLKERKKTKLLKAWIKEAKQKASITINEDLLYKD